MAVNTNSDQILNMIATQSVAEGNCSRVGPILIGVAGLSTQLVFLG